jgi:GT2 family glycosyltransferase
MALVAPSPDSAGAPRVAVIVPAYGVAHLVGEALASLQAQTLAEWECLVIDDGAPDDVAGAVAPFLSDPRIRFLATKNAGVSAARNQAIGATTAPLITLLDGDDLLRPNYLAAMVPVLEDDPAARLATCNARVFGAVAVERLVFDSKQGTSDGQHGSLCDVIDRSFGVYIGTTFRRADFDAIGGFDTSMAQSEDLDLWVRLMQLGGHARYVDQVLGDYRIRAGSASANATRMLLGNIKVFEKASAALAADQPEQAVLARAIAESRAAMAFEHAIDKVIDGDTRQGLAELRAIPGQVEGPVWRAAFTMWRIAPALARPMLRWRRAAHSRGAQSSLASKLADVQS